MKKEIVEEIHKYIDEPFKEYMSAIERFEEQPSILKGARKQEAKDKLDKAIRDSAEYVFETWNVPPEEFNKIIDEIMV